MQSRRFKKNTIYYFLALTLILVGYLASPIRIYFAGIESHVIASITFSVAVFLVGLIVALVTLLLSGVIADLEWMPGQVTFFVKWSFCLIGTAAVVISLYFAIWGFSLSSASPVVPVSETLTDSDGFSYVIYKIPGGAMSVQNYEVIKERSLVPGVKYSKLLCRSENYPGTRLENGKVQVRCD